MYFPGNYRWSAAFINMIGSIAYGGAEMGELHKIGRLLKGKGAGGRRSMVRRVRESRRRRARLRREMGQGRPPLFRGPRLPARVQLLPDGRALPHAQGREGARCVSARACECFHRHAKLTDVKIEIVEVPFEGGSLPGYFVHAQNAKSAAHAVRRLFRRPRRHQGDSVRAWRARPHQARHLGAW